MVTGLMLGKGMARVGTLRGGEGPCSMTCSYFSRRGKRQLDLK